MSSFANGISADQIVGVQWTKSKRSGSVGNCVEVAQLEDGSIAMRNSRFPTGPALVYTKAEIAAFFGGVQDGEFGHLV